MTIVYLRKSHKEHLCATLIIGEILLLTFDFANLSQGQMAEKRHSMANINLHQSQKEFLSQCFPGTVLYIL